MCATSSDVTPFTPAMRLDENNKRMGDAADNYSLILDAANLVYPDDPY